MSFTLDKDEYVIYEARRNWLNLWVKSFGLFFTILIPLMFISFEKSIQTIQIAGDQNSFLMVVLFSWVFIVWNLLFVVWTDHYLDVLVITNKNLINIEQKGLFRREVSVLHLSNVQDVTTEVTGLIQMIFNFGNLQIQSASAHTVFLIKAIDTPDLVRSKIKQAASGDTMENVK